MQQPVVATEGPRFEILYGVPTIVRRSAVAEDIAATYFVGGAARSFVDNTMVQNGITIREGEWIRVDPSTQKWVKGSPMQAPTWPVWQDPGVGRTDAPVGGISFIQGKWAAATNMITDGFHDGDAEFSVEGLVPGQELKVGILPVAHKYAGKTALVPVNFDDGTWDPTNTFYVVAHVERVFADDNVVIVNNEQGGYKVTVTQVLTTPAPTTA